jgi:hypothetical protein
VDGGLTWEPCPYCKRTVPRIVGGIGRASSTRELQFRKLKGTLINFDEVQTILDDTTEISEWQLEIRKANDDPHEVDELILHIAFANRTNPEQVVQKIRSRFLSEVEITPNRVELHSLEDMLKRIKLESALKELRILDSRPSE